MREYKSINPYCVNPGIIEDDYYTGSDKSIEIFESESKTFTGVLDSKGIPIYSVYKINPIGFNK